MQFYVALGNKLKGDIVSRFALKGGTFPLRTTSLLERSFGLQEAYTKICSYSANFFTSSSLLTSVELSAATKTWEGAPEARGRHS